MSPLVLASGSEIRAALLIQAGISFDTCSARVDEEAIHAALSQEQTAPRDIADALAEAKAKKISDKMPERLVLGCDQVLSLDADLFAKPASPLEASHQLTRFAGRHHDLHAAAVLYRGGRPIWRHVGDARLWVRQLSDAWIEGYVARNWESVRHCVGAYKLEEEGIRLFERIEGDYFTILGLPLIPLLNYLHQNGELET